MNHTNRLSLIVAGCFAASASLTPLAAQTDVGTAAALQSAIDAGDTNIVLTAPINVTSPINIGTTSSPTLTINGNGNAISGASEIFFVQSGNVTISNTTLSGNAAGGNSGLGDFTGGGALGAGGAIFVGASATVTASNVQFSNNTARGGNASVLAGVGDFDGSGGGGMNGGNGGGSINGGGGGGGGNGGNGGFGTELNGGGGGGLLSTGSDSGGITGGNGGGPHGGAGSNGTNNGSAGGVNSGGGGGGSIDAPTSGGNGGTNGGGGGAGPAVGGNGGAYAGGGGSDGQGGNGGFGGGGGAGTFLGAGNGGFGGGGGGATGGAIGTGGVGGGNSGGNRGGGGAALGGAVFEQAGGEFIMTGSGTYSGGGTVAGTGANNGASSGSDIFIMTGAGIIIAPGTGNKIVSNGSISDDSPNSLPSGSSFTPGAGTGVGIQFGSVSSPNGTVQLNGPNSFAGGTDITNGVTLVGGNISALGTGPAALINGTLTMGNGNHTLRLNAMSMSSTGTLALAVNGAGSAATADQLQFSNSANTDVSLGGNLVLNMSGFTMRGTSRFDLTLITTDNQYTGTFTSVTLEGKHGNYTATVDYSNPNDVTLDFTAAGRIFVPTFSALGLTPNQQAPLTAINVALNAGSTSPALTAIETALQLQQQYIVIIIGGVPTIITTGAGPAAFGDALDQLSPIKFANFASTTAFNNESFESQAMDTYLAGRRGGRNGEFVGGNGQVDTSEFTVNNPNIDPGLQMIHSRMLAFDTPGQIVSDIPGGVLGGIDMKKDAKDMKACLCCCPEITNPWNVFIRGNVILAQGYSQADQPHFDDNTTSVVVGADYRFTPHFLAGVTASYAHTDVTFDAMNNSATVDSYSPGIYASYSDGGWYGNFVGRYSYNSYTEARQIGFLGQTANGATDGHEGMADLDGGYDFHSGAWTFGPVAGLQYTHLTVNGYNESGSDASLAVNEDQADSLRSRVGGTVRFDFSGCGVTFSPHLTATWQHEFMDQARGLTSQFTNFAGGSFAVRTQNASKDSALVDAGLDAHVGRDVTVFADYLVQAGQDNYFGQSVQAGVRVNF